MRRLIASLTLVLFLFNILGYGGLLIKLKGIAGDSLTKRLDTNLFDMGGSLTLKVPFALPYGGYLESDYMINSEFEKDGEIYRVIKQRHYNDTLYMVCLKDDVSTTINNALNDFVQSFAGDDTDNQKNINSGLTKDYLTTTIGLSRIENGWGKVIEPIELQMTWPDVHCSPLTHPPSLPWSV